MKDVSFSIVRYNNREDELSTLILQILKCGLDAKIYLIDNSPEPASFLPDVPVTSVEYYYVNENIGFGAGHNIAIEKSIEEGFKYHVIVNPDVHISDDTVVSLFNFLNRNRDIGAAIPKVLNLDGSVQRLCKLLPSPLDLFGRRFMRRAWWVRFRNRKYELHHFDYDQVLNTPCLSGCFMFLRTSLLKETGGFDPQFFMYLEDYDLSRRIHQHAKTVYYPHTTILHGHNKESFKNPKMLRIHIRSAIKYFNKWGWFFDWDRKRLNTSVLERVVSKNYVA